MRIIYILKVFEIRPFVSEIIRNENGYWDKLYYTQILFEVKIFSFKIIPMNRTEYPNLKRV